MGLIEFNGTSTEELGLISQAIPAYEFPKKNYTYTHIPGRNGDVIMDSKSYENVNRTYYLASIYKPGSDLIINAHKIVSWLMSAKGYCRLEDSYEPDVYRLASYVDNGSLIDIEKTATTINVTFNCKPQRFLKSGEKEIEMNSNSITLNNPTGYDSLPIIKFVPTETGTLTITVGSYTITIDIQNDSINKSIFIDSEIQYCYMVDNNTTTNINQYVTLKDFPVLSAGEITVTFSGINCTNKTILPRWWKL